MTLPLTALIQGASASGGASTNYVDDVFSTYLYTGNGSTQTITNGIDLAGEGGLVWIKQRSSTESHFLFDTARTATYELNSNTTDASVALANSLTAFNSNGFNIGSAATAVNTNTSTYVSWTFRKAPKFFDVVTWSGNNTAGRTISHSLGQVPGMIIVKGTNTSGDQWAVYHRSLTGNGWQPEQNYLFLNATQAIDKNINYWNDTAPTSTNFTVGADTYVNTTGHDYVAYLFAHDDSADGIIQCGSSVVSGGAINVTLGWDPQYILLKDATAAGNWQIYDTMRGWNVNTASTDEYLLANSSGAASTTDAGNPTATGFYVNGLPNGNTYIYLAIRRPNKPPTSGTQVFHTTTRTGTNSAGAGVFNIGFNVDAFLTLDRLTYGWKPWLSRLTGNNAHLHTYSTGAETTSTQCVDFATQNGLALISNGNVTNNNGISYVDYFFRRAPGVFDVVCDTGTGANKTETHGLGVAPELWLRKGRSGATEWVWGSTALLNTEKIVMPSPNGRVTDTTAWNSTYPTATSFYVGTAATVNTSSATYVTYLWATKAGISKVFSYTGNGTNQTINCGFSAGARFVMIIRATASTAQDIFVWDSVRGIVSGSDPHLSLNTTAAEVTTDDSVDPDNSGFVVNQDAATNINVNGAVYFGLAFA